MKKKIFSLILAALLSVQTLSCFPASAADTTVIPEDVQEIEFDREYRAEAGEELWFTFKAPAPQCYFTSRELYTLEGSEYLYGQTVRGSILFDSNGNNLGPISYTNDPDVSDWTSFTPGERYYIRITPGTKGTLFTLSPVRQTMPAADPDRTVNYTDSRISLTAEGVERHFYGDAQNEWDVYRVTEELSGLNGQLCCYSSYFITDYRIHFAEEEFICGGTDALYSRADPAFAEGWDTLLSYTEKPESAIADGQFVTAANHYNYIKDDPEGEYTASHSYNVYVPKGKKLIREADGLYSDAAVNEIFSDVYANAWYTEAIQWANEKGYLVGMSENSFSPAGELTRAQFVSILSRIAKADLTPYRDRESFNDVKRSHWYHDAVEWAYDIDLTSGTGNAGFSPAKAVTRQELAAFMKNFAGYIGLDTASAADISNYSDYGKIADWAKKAFAWAVQCRLIVGTTDTTLSPRTNATRAQTALIIKNFCENTAKDILFKDNRAFFVEGGWTGYSRYEELIRMSGKEKPTVLSIGGASEDMKSGYDEVKHEFGKLRGCPYDELTLEDMKDGEAAKEKIMNADIIHVGSGDTRMLVARLRRYGTDEYIREAAEKGAILTGSSAGGIFPCSYGASGVDPGFVNLTGMGALDIMFCPHGLDEARVAKMDEFLLCHPSIVGTRIDNCALQIQNGKFRVYTEEGSSNTVAEKHYVKDGVLVIEDIESMEWRDLDELFKIG